MFDIGASELLVIVIVAIIVIGPKELPLALRSAGRWIAKIRRVSSHFRTGLDAMIREAELEDMDRKWKEQNEAIMRKYPASGPAQSTSDTQGKADEMTPLNPPDNATPSVASENLGTQAPDPAGGNEPALPFEADKQSD